jgi:hypothetical protein
VVAAELEVEDEVERCVRVGSASWVAVVLPFDIVDLDILGYSCVYVFRFDSLYFSQQINPRFY